ncbi:putative virulence effector, partial [Golovinomyces cichoracearum]
MADADSDVDMSPPTTPTRISSALSSLTSTPTRKSKKLRFADFIDTPRARLRSETPYSPGDPFIAFDKTEPTKISGNIMKATEEAFDKERLAIAEREQIAEEYARALDEATSRVQQLGLGKATGQLEKALSQLIKRFAHGENLLSNEAGRVGLTSSIYARTQ